MPPKTPPEIIPNCKTCYKKRIRQIHENTCWKMMLPASKSIPKGTSFLSLGLPFSCHFASGCASCLPPGTQGPRWPRSTKACQNHQKTHLKHIKLIQKRTLQDHVSGGPEPANPCLLFFFSGSHGSPTPARTTSRSQGLPSTSKNVADISSP